MNATIKMWAAAMAIVRPSLKPAQQPAKPEERK